MDLNIEPLLSQAEKDAIAEITHGLTPLTLADIKEHPGVSCRIYFDNGESITCTTDEVTQHVLGYEGLNGRWFVLPISVDIQDQVMELLWSS